MCNNRIDCPGGLEERNCIKRTCKHQFRCRKSARCVAITSICDAVNDCPLADDEYSCQVIWKECPSHCTCLLFVIECKDWEMTNNATFPYVKISIFNAYIPSITIFMKSFNQAVYFTLWNVSMSNICLQVRKSNKMSFTKSISIPFNDVSILSTRCFSSMPFLTYVNMSFNCIYKLEVHSFDKTRSLSILDVSHNKITHIIYSVFSGPIMLQLLNLKGNLIDSISYDLFELISIKKILTDSYKVCCISNTFKVACDSEPEWPYTCLSNVLNGYISKVFIWVFGVIGFFLNVFVLSSRGKHIGGGMNYHYLVRHIAASDLLFSIYLLILGIFDITYHRRYLENDIAWRSSIVCYFSCAVFLGANILSVFSMHLITMSKYFIIKYPIDSKFKKKEFVQKTILCNLLVAFVLSTCLVAFRKLLSTDGLMPTGLCNLLGNVDKSIVPQLTTWTIMISKFVPVILIPVINILLIYEMDKATKQIEKISEKHKSRQDQKLVHLLLASVCNVFCWVASACLLSLTLTWHKYPYQFLVLTSTTVFPIHTLTNPSVLILTQRLGNHLQSTKNNQKGCT